MVTFPIKKYYNLRKIVLNFIHKLTTRQYSNLKLPSLFEILKSIEHTLKPKRRDSNDDIYFLTFYMFDKE